MWVANTVRRYDDPRVGPGDADDGLDDLAPWVAHFAFHTGVWIPLARMLWIFARLESVERRAS